MSRKTLEARYSLLKEEWGEKGIDVDAVARRAMALRIETPSWAYANCGTRFGVVQDPAAPRTAYEKVADAAQVHKFTGITPAVAVHVLWDSVPDWADLQRHAIDQGIRIGAINPNLFTEPQYKFGSICSADPRIRRAAVENMKACVDIGTAVGSGVLSLWFADGTNYPGQGDFRRRRAWMEDCLAEVYAHLPRSMRMLLEYKLFEPAFYHTDIADWGIAHLLATKLGDRAQVLVDLGHHAHGTNIPWIVSTLITEGKLGGFHFNDRKYADDDLTTGCMNPYELFLIFNELVAGQTDPPRSADVVFMIDEMPVIKPRIESMIQSAVNLQEAYAKALLVDRRVLEEAQDANRIIDAEEVIRAAWTADVKPILEFARLKLGLNPDPLGAFRKSGYYGRILAERSAAARPNSRSHRAKV
ncbi:MAG TPA: L-rhamnose isomerase [Planctomycetota bacterium]|nr:L-rhamnose isomerase [Planctomycetota bacterium]